MPQYEKTLGPEVTEVCELAGFPPDPEQRLALDGLFALRPDGRAKVRDFGICAPRQNLKTGFLKQAALGWLYITEQRLIVWSAHEFSTSQEAFRDMCELIEGTPDLDAEVKQIHRGNGEEAIELFRDRRLKFKARTKSGGRGLTGDKIVLDEAMYLRPSHMGALQPTLRAVWDPQVVLAGSAGLADSDIWRGYRDRGRAGGNPRSAWMEYADRNPGGCVQLGCSHVYGVAGCALDDRARWWATNTALGRRITEETLEEDRRTLTPEEYARETVGWWEDPPEGGSILDLEAWGLLTRRLSRPERPAFGLEVALGRVSATVGAAWTAAGRPHVEPIERHEGVDWIVSRLAHLASVHEGRTVVLDGDTEAASLIDPLERAGLDVVVVRGGQRATACAGMYDATISGALTHNGDPTLTQAWRNARWKDVGEGSRAFSRRRSAGDIAALYAVTLALYGLNAARTSTYEGRGLVTL